MLSAKIATTAKVSAKARAKAPADASPAYPPPAEARTQGVEQALAAYASHAQRAYAERAVFSGLLVKHVPANDLDVVNWVHNRLPVEVLDRLLMEGVTKQEIGLVLPARTLAHRRANGEALTIEESDRAVRLARVLAQATSVFGDKIRGLAWLRQSLKRFEGRRPLDMLVSDVGSRLVEEALIQIDEGFFA